MTKTRIFCLLLFLIWGVRLSFGFTITEGPLFKSSTVGSLFLPCFDDSNLYAYRIDRKGLRIMAFDIHTLSLKRELVLTQEYIGLGDDIVGCAQSSNGNSVHISVTNRIKKEWKFIYWTADFKINEVRSLSDIRFTKSENGAGSMAYTLPEYKDVFGWTAWLNNDGTGYFWGIMNDPLTAVLVKAETETGKIIQAYEMEMKNDYGNWSRSFTFPKYVSKLIETEEAVYVLMHSENSRSGSTTYSNGATSYYTTYTYLGCWLFKMSKQKDAQWDVILPIRQKLVDYQGMTAEGYHNFAKGNLAEGQDNLYFFYNDDKDNQPSQTDMNMEMDFLNPAEADDGFLVAITLSKKTGDWQREVIYKNNKTGSFFNCKDGIQIDEKEFIIPVDLPKKNSGQLVKITF